MTKLYIVLCALSSVLVILANITCQKLVYVHLPLHTFEMSVGDLLYPFLFMFTDVIVEFYGRKNAKFCTYLAMLLMAVTSLILTGLDLLPATPWSNLNNEMFHKIFGISYLLLIMFITVFYLDQLTDITVYSLIKKLTGDKWLWLRNVVSTAIAFLVDSVLYIWLGTLIKIFPAEQMVSLMINTYSYKLLAIGMNIPLFYLLVGMIKRFVLMTKPLSLKDAEMSISG